MAVKDQLKLLKDNWLIIAIALALVVLLSSPLSISNAISRTGLMAKSASYESRAISFDSGFAPEEQDRKITKTASISSEVSYGEFSNAVSTLKQKLKEYSAFLLNENINAIGENKNRHYGSFKIKVKADSYEELVNSLKSIGELKYFSENSYDFTKSYLTAKDRLNAEKARLERFKEMLKEAKETEDKISITDRIFDLEKSIAMLEKQLEAMNNKEDYSTIYFNIAEKEPFSAGFIGFKDIVRSFVNSINSLIKLFAVVLPWAVVALALWLIRKAAKRKS